MNSNNDILDSETDRLKRLKTAIAQSLRELKEEEEQQVDYTSQIGCNKKNFIRVFNILDKFDKLANKEPLRETVYYIIYILWSPVTIDEKIKLIALMKSEKKCDNLSDVELTIDKLDLIVKWVKLNSLSSNKSIPYILFLLDSPYDVLSNISNKELLPLMNKKIQEINTIIASNPNDDKMMDKLADLIFMFSRLKDTVPIMEIRYDKITYDSHYYRNMYNMILLFWAYIEANVPNYYNHRKYPYIFINMKRLSVTDVQNITMNRVAKKVLSKPEMKKLVEPKTPENVNRLRKANLLNYI
jgi:hypothetical protein